MKVRNQKYLIAFGENLKKLINSKKVTPEYVATHGYIETKQIYRVLNAEHSATISIVYAIAKGLDIKPKELFDFEFDES